MRCVFFFFKNLLSHNKTEVTTPDGKASKLGMSRNLAPKISRGLHSDCFAMVLTAGFYRDSRAHNVRKVRVVKYMVVYGQVKNENSKK